MHHSIWMRLCYDNSPAPTTHTNISSLKQQRLFLSRATPPLLSGHSFCPTSSSLQDSVQWTNHHLGHCWSLWQKERELWMVSYQHSNALTWKWHITCIHNSLDTSSHMVPWVGWRVRGVILNHGWFCNSLAMSGDIFSCHNLQDVEERWEGNSGI